MSFQGESKKPVSLRRSTLLLLSMVVILVVPLLLGARPLDDDPWPPIGDGPLDGSMIETSKDAISSSDSEPLKYTITLHNAGEAAISADVSDAIPDKLVYVDGSANRSGDFDEDKKIVSWSGIEVPANDEVVLTFEVKARDVEQKIVVMNIADITPDGNADDAFSVGVTVWVIPGDGSNPPPHEANGELAVKSVEICKRGTSDAVDVLTAREVTLRIDATDSNGETADLSKMAIREWAINPDPMAHWDLVKESGWIDFDAVHDWRLVDQDGVHFISVRVKDTDDKVSEVTRDSFDFASLIRDGAKTPELGIVPYLVYYTEGTHVTASLNATEGTAGLFVWKPQNFGPPDHFGDLLTAKNEVKFTANADGIYIFLAFSLKGATYDLEISPAGGDSTDGGAAALSAMQASGATAYFTSEPVFSVAGLYPTGADAADPPAIDQPAIPLESLFLPVVVH